MARSTSSAVATGTVSITSPLYGLRSSSWRAPLLHSPATYMRMGVSPFSGRSAAVQLAARGERAAAARAPATMKPESEPIATKVKPSAR